MEIPYALRSEVKFVIFETGALGPIGAFSSVADIASIGGWWGYLLFQYSKHYGYRIDEDTAKRLCISTLAGLGGYYAGCKTATKLFNLIPGAGTIMAMGLSSIENIIFTYRFAVTLTRVFEKGEVNFDTIKDTVKIMFAGTGKGLLSVKEIAQLCFEN